MKRHRALIPTPTSRDWKGCHATKGLLHEGRLFLLPSYVAYILEGITPPPYGNRYRELDCHGYGHEGKEEA